MTRNFLLMSHFAAVLVLCLSSCDNGLKSELLKGFRGSVTAIPQNNGIKQWTALEGVSPGKLTSGQAVAIDRAGNTYVTGTTNGNLSGQTAVSASNGNIFVIKY